MSRHARFDPASTDMELTLAALIGALIALTVRELVERHERIQTKRANCIHVFDTVDSPYNTKTLLCRYCGYQTPKDET